MDSENQNKIFRQRSNELLSAQPVPLIQVRPIRNKVKCVVGEEVILNCRVNDPYTVQFEGIPTAGKTNTKKKNHYEVTHLLQFSDRYLRCYLSRENAFESCCFLRV